MTKAEVMKRVQGLSDEQKKAVVCSLVGHSRIVTGCFGYVYCGRCGAQVADSLGGVNSDAENQVRVGHNCKVCRKNYAALDWRHKLFAPDPFKKATA